MGIKKCMYNADHFCSGAYVMILKNTVLTIILIRLFENVFKQLLSKHLTITRQLSR